MRRGPFVGLVAAMVASVAIVTALGTGVRATYGAHTTADEPQYLLTALSLWEDGDLDISDELASQRFRDFHEADLPTQTRVMEDGRRVSPHDPLLPLLLAIPMGLGGWVGAKLALASMAGALAGLLLWVAHRRLGVRAGVGALVIGALSLSPPLGVYATQVYPELPAALVVTGAIAALMTRPSPRVLAVAAVMVVALPWLAIKYAPVAAILAIVTLVRAPGRHRVALLASFGLAAVAYVAGHLALYGGLTPYAAGDHFVGGEFTVVGTEVDLWARSTRLAGLLVDSGFGLGAWQPAFLLLPAAAAWSVGRRSSGWALLVAVLAAGWLTASFVALTMHGWWFPGRQVVVVIPAAVLLLTQWADAAESRFRTLGAFSAVGAGAFAFLLWEGSAGRLTWVVDFGATAYPLHRLLSWLLPDYMTPSSMMWLRHGLWVAVLVGLAVVGWLSARTHSTKRPVATAGLSTQTERHAT